MASRDYNPTSALKQRLEPFTVDPKTEAEVTEYPVFQALPFDPNKKGAYTKQ